jgi:hypothetical protein
LPNRVLCCTLAWALIQWVGCPIPAWMYVLIHLSKINSLLSNFYVQEERFKGRIKFSRSFRDTTGITLSWSGLFPEVICDRCCRTRPEWFKTRATCLSIAGLAECCFKPQTHIVRSEVQDLREMNQA